MILAQIEKEQTLHQCISNVFQTIDELIGTFESVLQSMAGPVHEYIDLG
jgi:hypothetical protein